MLLRNTAKLTFKPNPQSMRYPITHLWDVCGLSAPVRPTPVAVTNMTISLFPWQLSFLIHCVNQGIRVTWRMYVVATGMLPFWPHKRYKTMRCSVSSSYHPYNIAGTFVLPVLLSFSVLYFPGSPLCLNLPQMLRMCNTWWRQCSHLLLDFYSLDIN